MTKTLYRIGRATAAHPFRTIGVWMLVALAVLGLKARAGGAYEDDFRVPGVEAQKAFDRLDDRFPTQAGAIGQVVFHSDDRPLTGPAEAAGVDRTLEQLAAARDVTGVSDLQLSPDGRTGFASIQYGIQFLEREAYDDAQIAAEAARAAGVQVELNGSIADAVEHPEGKEGIGIIAAVVILLVAFGSVIAMGIPIGTALFAIVIGLAGVSILAGIIDVPEVAPMLATMIGLGVGSTTPCSS